MKDLKLYLFAALMFFGASAHADVSGVQGMNGVSINKALEFIDPNGGFVSYCSPNDDAKTYTCIHLAEPYLVNLVENGMIQGDCIIVTIPDHGPELVCGQYKERVDREGIQWIIDMINEQKGISGV